MDKEQIIKKAFEIKGLMTEEELGVIYDLCKKYVKPNGRVYETGTYFGRTSFLIAKAVEEIKGTLTTVDIYNHKGGEFHPEYEERELFTTMENLIDCQNIYFTEGNSTNIDIIENINNSYDLVFLDGDHRHYSVLIELEMAKYMSNTIAGHDWHDDGVRTAVEKFVKENNYELVEVFPTQQGIWLLNKII